jgi:hypothetical protein
VQFRIGAPVGGRKKQTARSICCWHARPARHSWLSALWTEAQELANEALHVAQTAWNAVRAQAGKLRVELLSAFETQGAEFEALRLKLAEVEKGATTAAAASERSRGESAQQVVALTDQAHTASARAREIGEYGTYDGQVPGGGASRGAARASGTIEAGGGGEDNRSARHREAGQGPRPLIERSPNGVLISSGASMSKASPTITKATGCIN